MACTNLDYDAVFSNGGDSGMTPERWQQIEALYHAALEREPESRGAFLTGACHDDELRAAVEVLLRQDGTKLDHPAWEAFPTSIERSYVYRPGSRRPTQPVPD